MEPEMSMEDVVSQLRHIQSSGESLSKKKMKQAHPDLMKNALYYFPSWEHAIQNL